MQITSEELKWLMSQGTFGASLTTGFTTDKGLVLEEIESNRWALKLIKDKRFKPFGGLNQYDVVKVQIETECCVCGVEGRLKEIADHVYQKGCIDERGAGGGQHYTAKVTLERKADNV